MALLHASIAVSAPERAARLLADLMGGAAHPFPPCPGGWIAFAAADDGSAIEVYPAEMRIVRGARRVAFEEGPPDLSPGSVHLAIASPLRANDIIDRAMQDDWPARICHRGPFSCVELWIEERLLIEVLDHRMQADYRASMTARNWRDMFRPSDAAGAGD